MNPPTNTVLRWGHDLVGLFLPRRCGGCNAGMMHFEHSLCTTCEQDLPRTRFHEEPLNQVEQLFRGKVEIQAASAFLHFSSAGMVQQMLHRLKYDHDRQLGIHLGRLMGEELASSPRFSSVDALLAVPLHPRKEHMRGYNQSQVLVDGIRQRWPLESLGTGLMRVMRTPSQTRRSRLARWMNVKEAFHLPDPGALRGRHVLIVDDVVTTGATLEGCVKALATASDIRISVFTAACA